ncbi:MAG TPA: SRPBCC family protein [Ktedonobacterales bacterium]|nr:SRPBCC family protein [Ktedonobacterales bacterium]
MAHAENTVVIARPPEVVYAFLLEGANNPHWRPPVLGIARVPGTPDGVGARYAQQLKGPGGRTIAGDYEITRAEPNTEIAFKVTAGPARPTGEYALQPEGAGTRVRFVLDYQPTGLARLMDGMIERTMRTEVGLLTSLKAYLESQPA